MSPRIARETVSQTEEGTRRVKKHEKSRLLINPVAKSFRARLELHTHTPWRSGQRFAVMRFHDAISRMLAVALRVIFFVGRYLFIKETLFFCPTEHGFQRYPIGGWFYDFPAEEECSFIVHVVCYISRTFLARYRDYLTS